MNHSTTANIPTVRRREFSFGMDIPRYWAHESVVATHIGNTLHLIFPEGERHFVRSVEHYRDRITDPELLERVDAFVGQEGQHAREHHRFAATIRAQGYEIDPFLRGFRKSIRSMEKIWPPAFLLADTVACEHFTAIMGAHALSTPHLDAAPPVLRDLLRWHAAEEIEHKSVAFDVLKAVHPSYFVRMAGMVMATVGLMTFWLVGVRMLLRQEGIGWIQMRKEARRVRTMRQEERIFTRVFLKGIRDYMRPSFHPDDVDDLHLAQAWLNRSEGGSAAVEPEPA